MKKLIWIVTITVLGILACQKKDGAPTPVVKKYEYKRTPGEVTEIEGGIYADTGGSIFTVRGKGFDRNRRKYYHLLIDGYCAAIGDKKQIVTNGYRSGFYCVDTAQIMDITDSTIKFWVKNKNLFSVRRQEYSCYASNDSIMLQFAVTSKDSSGTILNTLFDKLYDVKVKNQLFFNIIKDTIYWHKNSNYKASEIAITVDDVLLGWSSRHFIEMYFNDIKINTSNDRISIATELAKDSPLIGDSFFFFGKDFYNDNKNLGLIDGFYNITMKESKTGLPIKERHDKKRVYVKFVD